MTIADVDVIIAIHDVTRPIERAVRSLLCSPASQRMRVIVVCHGISEGEVLEALNGFDHDRLQLIEFSDGIRSPAGPFNRGLDEASAEYVCVMGSDDFLEPEAMHCWLTYIDRERPPVALAPLSTQDGRVLHNPLARPSRVRDLDVVRDRVFYRTAPLGLLKREVVEQLGLRFQTGLRSGDDLSLGVHLWTSGLRIDYLRRCPRYVIGSDANTRVTTSAMSIEESFEPLNRLAREAYIAGLPHSVRRALAIKLVRVHILGALTARSSAEAWRDDDEVAQARATLASVLSLADGVLAPFPRVARTLLDSLSDANSGVEQMTAAAERAASAGILERNLTRNPIHLFDRESTLRRYAVYALSR